MIKTPGVLGSRAAPSEVLYASIRHGQSQKFSTDSRTRRKLHGSSARPSPPADQLVASATPLINPIPVEVPGNSTPISTMPKSTPLSVLPLATILRTLASTTISSSPLLLPPSLKIMSTLAHSNQAILNPDRNPMLRWFLKKTFYAQFCAGENAAEVRHTVNGLKKIGFTGVLLGYAREVVLTEAQQRDLSSCGEGEAVEECIRNEITPWKTGTMATIRLASKGDFVSVKFSGAGRQALYALKNRLPPSKPLAAAIEEVCELAKELDVPLLIDAEQTAVQNGIDDWAMHYQRRYNTTPGHAIIYNTYQAYLKATPLALTSHLDMASKEGFTLGVKLVRGAYLGSDPRHIIHDTKEDTDNAYDGIAASLITRRWGSVLKQHEAAFPPISIVLGSHNLESVCKARAIRNSPASAGTELAIAQLMGMADEVSCELLGKKQDCEKSGLVEKGVCEAPRAYKYIVWGTTKECMAYLLRRAHENKDAVQRTKAGRDAAWNEVKRRVWAKLGLV
ncbi:proline dehydrogenase [Xylariaceae sp. FL1019]|nr:proline dehydrogenase [Xylariaceae sp. FL1019]